MQVKINDVNINYCQYGEGNDILLLHGWGQNIEMMKPIGDNLCNKYRITILDLPGFGLSEEPKYAWDLNDYSNMLEDFVKITKLDKPVVIGHSFGGRLAIKYSSNNRIEKLILFGSPVTIEKGEDNLKVKFLKKIKKLPGMDSFGEYMKKYIGSRDYKNASPIMRQVLVNTVNYDLVNDAKKIEEPTLVIWGDYDTEAPISDAKLLESIMPDAGLIVLHGTHYAYLENISQVINILRNFLGGKD